jgi:DNA-binding response OmpR family regulator
MASQPRHILVVDDSPHIGVLCRIQFEHRGYRVSVAGTLADARRSLAADPPDAVLLDIHLPDGLGLELLDELRRSAATSSLPVIVVTAEGDEQMLQESRRLGATVLTKPFSPSKLAARVLSMLGEPPEMPEGDRA